VIAGSLFLLDDWCHRLVDLGRRGERVFLPPADKTCQAELKGGRPAAANSGTDPFLTETNKKKKKKASQKGSRLRKEGGKGVALESGREGVGYRGNQD